MCLTGLLLMTHSACFLIQPRTTCLGMAPPTVGWALPHQPLIKKKNVPTDLPMGQYDGGTILSSEFLFPEISRFVSS